MTAEDVKRAPSSVPRPPRAPTPPSARTPPAPPRTAGVPPKVAPGPRVSGRPQGERASLDPSVLVVGADETFLPALRLALDRHRVHVESASMADAVETAVVAAPDLILLAGDAARDPAEGLLSRLTSSPVSSVIPLVLLGEQSALAARLNAFRHGAAAVIPRSASIDAVATEIARLAREIPERGGDALGELGEATLEEFVGTLTSALRSGILSVTPGSEQAPLRLVLGRGQPLAAVIDDFVQRVRAHVVHAEPLKYEFDDRAGGTLQITGGDTAGGVAQDIQGLRLLLADDDPARSDAVAQELRARGAQVAVTSLNPSDGELALLRGHDLEVLLVGEREIEGQGYALVRRMKQDLRLRWTSLLVVRWDEIRDPEVLVPVVDRITAPLAELAEVDRGLTDRAALGDAFDARLEANGPARCLRALAASGRALRVHIYNTRISAELDISDGLLVGATATAPTGERWEGATALAAVLVIGSGRLRVEPAQQPASTNVMAEVEAAFNLAEAEPAPIVPSLPVSAMPSAAPPPPDRTPAATSVAPPSASTATSSDATSAHSERAAMVDRTAAPRPHATWKQKGVSGRTFAALIVAAIIIGLSFAWVTKRLTRHRPSTAVPSTAPERSTPSAVASAQPATELATPASAEPAAAPNRPAEGATDHGASAAAPSTGGDESGTRAPSCDALLADAPPSAASPTAALDQLKQARRLLVMGKTEDAQRAYCAAARLDPHNPMYFVELAQLLLIRRDGAAAAAAAKQALELDANSTKAQWLVGDGLARTGDAEGARRAWFAAANLQDPDERTIERLATSSAKEAEQAFDARDYARAERFYRRAVLLAPSQGAGGRGLALSLLRLGDRENALRWARHAAEHAPDDAAVQTTLGDAALAMGDKTGARAALERAGALGSLEAKQHLARLGREP